MSWIGYFCFYCEYFCLNCHACFVFIVLYLFLFKMLYFYIFFDFFLSLYCFSFPLRMLLFLTPLIWISLFFSLDHLWFNFWTWSGLFYVFFFISPLVEVQLFYCFHAPVWQKKRLLLPVLAGWLASSSAVYSELFLLPGLSVGLSTVSLCFAVSLRFFLSIDGFWLVTKKVNYLPPSLLGAQCVLKAVGLMYYVLF